MEVSTIRPLMLYLSIGLRHDSRRPYELRSISLDLQTHPSSDGSATVTQGLTTVQCCVFGPREAKQRANTSHDKAGVVVEVGVAPWAGSRETKRTRGDKYVCPFLDCNMLMIRRLLEIGAAVRQTFEPVIMTHLYPRSEIAIHIQVISADGGLFDHQRSSCDTDLRNIIHRYQCDYSGID